MVAPDLRPKLDMEVCDEPEPEPEPEPGTSQASKRRKVVRRTVLRVKMEENVGKQRNNEGPPSDFWSWRKYGQKPIKGSPYPRGYYRCSTSKGCSAKKQVERCKTDASVLVITYTSTHNHPGPDIHSITNINHPTQQSPIHPPETSLSSPTNSSNQGDQDQEQEQEQEKEREREQQLDGDSINSSSDSDNQDQQQQQQQRQPHLLTSREGHTKPEEDAYFHYLPSPARYCPQDPFSLAIDKTGEEDHPDLPLHMDDEEPLSCSHHIMSSAHHVAPKSSSEDSCDFFDELEELPTYSSFSYFKRPSNYYLVDERIRVVPS